MCQEFSQCYDDVNICLWTDGSQASQSAAQSACEQRGNFLPRITNNNIQSKLAEFRRSPGNVLGENGFWIDVKAVGVDNFHWINGSQLAGWFVYVTAGSHVRENLYASRVDHADVMQTFCANLATFHFFTLVYCHHHVFKSGDIVKLHVYT